MRPCSLLRRSIILAVIGSIVVKHNDNIIVDALSTVSSSQSTTSVMDDMISSQRTEINSVVSLSSSNNDSLSSIRIRSTREQDLPTIIDLLAYETAITGKSYTQESKQQMPLLFGNWNTSFKKLKNEASLSTQLKQRLEAKIHATKVISSQKRHFHSESIEDQPYSINELRYVLWNDDTFRYKLEKAAKTTATWEGTIWDNWNFAITPKSNMLHHFMLTALDQEFIGNLENNTGDNEEIPAGVVGFCEVGICSVPLDCHGAERHIPCIGNLVVSPNHRRRGIGKKLVQSVIRLVRYTNYMFESSSSISNTQESENFADTLGLYVDKDNMSAIRLYEREGFEVAREDNGKESGRILMSINL